MEPLPTGPSFNIENMHSRQGNRPRPINLSSIENTAKSPQTMKKLYVKHKSKNSPSDVIGNCAVCLEPVKGNMYAATKFKKKLERPVAVLCCGHSFHLDCIGNAFNAKQGMECPCCRETQPGEWNEELRHQDRNVVNAERVDLFVSIQRAVLFRELLNLPRPRANSAPTPPAQELVVESSPVVETRAVEPDGQRDESYAEPGLVVVTATRAGSPRRRRPRRPRALSLSMASTDQNPFRRRTRRRLTTSLRRIADEQPPQNAVSFDAPLTPVIRRVVNLAKAELDLLQREIAQYRSEERPDSSEQGMANSSTPRGGGTEDSSRSLLQSRRTMFKEALGIFRLTDGLLNNMMGVNAEEMEAASMWLKRHISDAQSELRRLHRSEASREAALLRRIGVLREFSASLGQYL